MKVKYRLGEVFKNKWLGNKLQEVLNLKKIRVGYLWTLTTGRVVVSPHLGMYLWFGADGKEWTSETGALWLIETNEKIKAPQN